MKTEGLCPQPMAFKTVMEFIGADGDDVDGEVDFDSRVWMYLVALMLGQKRYVMSSCIFTLSFHTLLTSSTLAVLLILSLRS